MLLILVEYGWIQTIDKGSICSAMKSKSRFIKRTGMAAAMVCRTRIPVAFASASFLRLLSCSALKLVSVFADCFLEW